MAFLKHWHTWKAFPHEEKASRTKKQEAEVKDKDHAIEKMLRLALEVCMLLCTSGGVHAAVHVWRCACCCACLGPCCIVESFLDIDLLLCEIDQKL